MLFNSIAPIFLVLGIGFFLRKRRILTGEADQSLLKICVHLLAPCLIASSILGNELLTEKANLWLPPLTGFICVTAGYLLAWIGGRLLRLQPGPELRTFVFVTAIYNYGYIAIPVAEQLFGQKSLGILFAHSLGVEIAFWTGAALILAKDHNKGEPIWRQLLTTPVIAIFVSIFLNLFGVDDHLPGWLMGGVRMLGAASIPLALLLAGATMADFSSGFTLTRSSLKTTLGACVLRFVVLPFVFIALALWLPCTKELREVLVIEASMPCGMFPLILVRLYGGDAAMATRIIIVTTVLGLILIPYWINLGLHLLGM